MKMPSVQMIIISLIGFSLAIFIIILVECYIFSWVGFLSNKVDLCKYKSITVPTQNGQPQELSYDFDTQNIARVMMKKENYRVKQPGDDFTIISRQFGRVYYEIWFRGPGRMDKGFYLKTSVDGDVLSTTEGGEKCITPNYILKENVFAVIEDLPLTALQKDEMKKYVKVNSITQLKLW